MTSAMSLTLSGNISGRTLRKGLQPVRAVPGVMEVWPRIIALSLGEVPILDRPDLRAGILERPKEQEQANAT